MHEVILFFPDIKKLVAFTAQLQCGPLEIETGNLTVKTSLEADQILDAMLLYEATPCHAGNWEKLERWMAECSQRPYGRQTGYHWDRSR